ncbi:AAA family ATPase [Exiguobacterium sp. s56]|uniref:AAA family ATPase n=1 Tax=Exiguobacterium sp. s56 TaxID=2751232 RepID=UPI001BEB8961|nr:AAA family ATPase [Exiguobacterium sp. s56]
MIFIQEDFQGNDINYDEYVLLVKDNWNDWWEYKTLYSVYYVLEGKSEWLGNIKIGFLNENYIEEGKNHKAKRPNLPPQFSSLAPHFFSVGQDLEYYSKINSLLLEDKRIELLSGLCDISLSSDLYSKVIDLHVTRRSIIRNVARSSIKGQFKRLANGNAELSKFNFSFSPPNNETSSKLKISVIPKTLPPTNIHTLIGRNGVGKTHFLSSLIKYLCTRDSSYGQFEYQSNENVSENEEFANLIAVSFSAFDSGFDELKKEFSGEFINFDTIGWSYVSDSITTSPDEDDIFIKDRNMHLDFLESASRMFILSLETINASGKSIRWKRTIEKLYSDPMFKNSESSNLMNFINEDKKYIVKVFEKMSSGHKIVLLTLTQLIEKIEERSLVILDEPELHLHPPLLSAFIRALSDILIYRNAVAIIATHSPVVIQEIPKKCVSIIDRLPQSNAVFFREPTIETFGNNVGVLTSTVFNLEVSNSGFYEILKKLVKKNNDFEEIMSELDWQLGPEGVSILLSLINEKNKEEF